MDGINEIHEASIRSGNDLQWIRRIGYSLIAFGLGFFVSLWGIFYPQMQQFSSVQQDMKSSIAVNSIRLAALEKFAEESKLDRHQLKEELNRHMIQQSKTGSNPP